jgi:2-C-methyl-D-erythritol 4-phosphate cytidylyltransferase/2-C-methyl-D-erythritol 2,4-cyclodiphosphate synthase
MDQRSRQTQGLEILPVRIAALIVAAGRGTRAGTELPKQYLKIGPTTVLDQAVAAFAGHPAVTTVQVVIHPDDREIYAASLSYRSPKIAAPVAGGASRQSSVRLGLTAIAASGADLVLIHDAARPFIPVAVIDRVIAALDRCPGAVPALPVADTLKRATGAATIAATVPRDGLWRAQTPQGFRFSEILAAHEKAADAGRDDFTDDAAIAEWAGLTVALVDGATENTKITTAADVFDARRKCEAAMHYEPRIGTGFDVHRFAPGTSVWLCGVEIPHTKKLEGHSDADVGLHALTDALLGTIGDGDIGHHFPPTDPQWKGARSSLFLEDAARRVRGRGGQIVNVDVTVLAEAPRIGPHRPAMQACIAGILGITPDRVGIKATTMEELGAIGRREGIVAMASALVLLPFSVDQERT